MLLLTMGMLAVLGGRVPAQAQSFGTTGSSGNSGWVQRNVTPGARLTHVFVSDSARDRSLLFGGTVNGSTNLGDSWLWDGAAWSKSSPVTSPSARRSSGAAYDPVRGRIVLFGGFGAAMLNDTWEWDGGSWTQAAPSSTPTVRYQPAMAHDAARGAILLFGGSTDGNTGLADTWTFDGVDWTQLSPASSPPGRRGATLAYDSARSRLVLFGGIGGQSGPTYNDTWEWDGTTWIKQTPAASPPARVFHQMRYDPVRSRTVLFGGLASNLSTYLGDTWEWDGTSWTQAAPAASPPARYGHDMTYDAARQRVTLCSGSTVGDAKLVWEYDGTTWEPRPNPTQTPLARQYFAMAYDSARAETVMYGGRVADSTTWYGDLWTWNGTVWTQKSPTSSPGPRYNTSFAFDSTRGLTTLFGATDGSGIFADTWTWDGTNWTQQAPATVPAARQFHFTAFDSFRGNTIVFGGASQSGVYRGDTAQYDGTNWSVTQPSPSPSPRGSPLAFDSKRNLTALYGGQQSVTVRLADTWEWDGTAWTQRAPATSPGIRGLHALAYDSTRQRTVLFGGYGPSAYHSDTWEWDGTDWTQRTFSVNPPVRFGAGLVYDTSRRTLVLFAGQGGSVMNDTWELPSNSSPGVNASYAPAAPTTGQVVTMTSVFSDPDGDTPTFLWRQTVGPAAPLTGETNITATFTPNVAAAYGFEVVARDGYGGTSFARGTIVVGAAVNRPPSVSAGASRIVTVNTLVRLAGTATDPDGDSLTYTWTQLAGTGQIVTLTDPATLTPSFTPPAGGTYSFTFSASDGRGGTTSDAVTITANTPPAATASGPGPIVAGMAATLTASGSDPDGDALAYRWSQTAGTAVSIADPSAARIVVTPPSPGTYAFLVTVSDGSGAFATASVTLTVTQPPLPDLVALSISAGASSVEINKPLSLTGSVRNSGLATSGPFAATIVLSADTAIDAGDPALGTVSQPGLAAGATRDASATFSVPGSIAPGAYFAGFRVDSAGAVVESDETNNAVASTGNVTVRAATVFAANLVARSVSGPATARAGSPFDGSVGIENAGNLDVTRSFGVSYFVSLDRTLDGADAAVGADTLASLAAGARVDRVTSLFVPDSLAAGAYFLLASVDPSQAVTQSSRTDDVLASALAIQIAARPSDTIPPTATLTYLPGTTVLQPVTLRVTATFSEPIAITPDVQVSSSSGGSLAGTITRLSPSAYLFTAPLSAADNGSYTLVLGAADLAGNALVAQPAGNAFNVAIPVNRPPVADAGSAQVVRVGATGQLSGLGSDPDGDAIAYSWQSPAGISLSDARVASPTFVASASGTYRLTLTVTDARGSSSVAFVEIGAGTVTAGRRATVLHVSGSVRFASGEVPAAGARVLLRNPRTGSQQSAAIDPASGFYETDLPAGSGGDAAASGDSIEPTLSDGSGSTLPVLAPAAFFVTDEAVGSGSARIDVVAAGAPAAPAVLLTLAGTGAAGYSGDGTPAATAAFDGPDDLAFDAAGNLYICDAGNGRVRRITPGGIVTTVAGSGSSAASGDGGQARAAGIGLPSGLAVSTDGKLFISDRLNHRVRRVDLATGLIAAVAGTGSPGFSGDGLAAASAVLDRPCGLRLAGTLTLFVADSGNHRVRRVDLADGTIRTVVGNGVAGSTGDGGAPGSASLFTPLGLAFDLQGRLLVAELEGHRVRRIDLVAGRIETVAGSAASGQPDPTGQELATQTRLWSPARLAVRSSGDLLVSERGGFRIRAVDAVSGRIRTVAGSGERGSSFDGANAGLAALDGPAGVALAPDGSVVFAEAGGHRIRRVAALPAGGADDHPDTAAAAGPGDALAAGGAPASGTIESAGDADLFSFTASLANVHEIRTSLGTLDDSVLTLLDRDGVRVIAENDDAGGSRAAAIEGFRPPVAGSYFVRVRGFRSAARGTYRISLSAEPEPAQPAVATAELPAGVAGRPYAFLLHAAGGVRPLRWVVAGGALPPGFELDEPSGLLSGTFGASGHFPLTVSVIDAAGSRSSRRLSLDLRPADAGPLPGSPHPYPANADDIQSLRLPGAPAAVDVTFDDRTFLEAGYDFLHVLGASGAGLPGSPFTGSGLAGRTLRVPGDTVTFRLVSDGVRAGFGYQIADASPAENVSDTLSVSTAPPLPGATLRAAYSARLQAPGAAAPLQWSLAAGSQLPAGLQLDTQSGTISGTPASAGDFVLRVRVRDANGSSGSARLLLPVFAPGGADFPESQHPYSGDTDDVQSFTLDGNPAALLVTFDARTELEPGFDALHVSNGSGTPIAGSPFRGRALAGKTVRVPGATVRLALASGGSPQAFGYRVARIAVVPASPAPLAWLTPADLGDVALGVSLDRSLLVTGGVLPYEFDVTAGQPPPGAFLEGPAGKVAGIPSAAGTFGFSLRVSDAGSPRQTLGRGFTVRVTPRAAPGVALATVAAGETFTADLRLTSAPEPLASVTFLVAFDDSVLSNPRGFLGDAAAGANLGVDFPGPNLARVLVAGAPAIARAGSLARIDFESAGGLTGRRGLVTILSAELRTAGDVRRLLRPTANAGANRSLRVRFRAAGVPEAAIPDPLAPAESNLRTFVRLDGRQSEDPNRPPKSLSYSWTQVAGPPATLSNPRSPVPTFVPPRDGEYGFELVANNGELDSPPDRVAVVVGASNSPPSAEIQVSGAGAGGLFPAGQGAAILDGTFSTDSDPTDARSLKYAWRQTRGRPVTLLDSASRRPSTTAPRLSFVPPVPGVLTFELVVTDPAQAASPAARADVRVRLASVRAPQLSILATAASTAAQGDDTGEETGSKPFRSLRVRVPDRVTLVALVTDPDIGKPPLKHRLRFGWRQSSGPAVRLDGALAASTETLASAAVFEPATAGVHVFECRVAKLDSASSPTGVEVAREIRVVVDTPDNQLPEAAFDLRVPGGGGQFFTKASYPVQRSGQPSPAVVPGTRVQLDGTRSADSGPGAAARLLYRWVQTAGPRVLLSNPFGPLTTFVVPELRGDRRSRVLRFGLLVDDGRDASEPVAGELLIAPPPPRNAALPLRAGLSLVSLPLDPSTTGQPFSASDLLAQTLGRRDKGFVVRAAPAREGEPGRFEVFLPGTPRPPFVLDGNQGYLAYLPAPPASVTLSGLTWAPSSAERWLDRGLNLLAFPAGTPAGFDAEKLRRLTGAGLVARLGPAGRFQAYVPGLVTPFEVDTSSAYLIVMPAPAAVTLPAGP